MGAAFSTFQLTWLNPLSFLPDQSAIGWHRGLPLPNLRDFHPAELPGPSSHRNLSLLGIPAETRIHIYRELLMVGAQIDLDIEQNHDKVNEIRCMVPSSQTPRKGRSTSILRVCRKMTNEALDVLYGDNTFLPRLISWNDECSENDNGGRSLSSQMRLGNASRIKTLIFQLSAPVSYLYFDEKSPSFNNLVDYGLCGLQCISLSETRVTGAARQNELALLVLQLDRVTALKKAAAIAQQHPVLKQAVWRYESGGKLFKQMRHGKTVDLMRTTIKIDLVAPGHRLRSPARSLVLRDFHLEEFATKDILLDCGKIEAMSSPELRKVENIAMLALREDRGIDE
ncbi:hypothetical protein H2200_012328 [Cladophialophora chaetospira]|uniref:Uncharacterized protein n=1 Tax=Cladophialophora chaetospira TaxID=386627 RepID=A0AA39CCA1_9EURO|nr:hypothetical protein H2200_012328 [Cladophialophora chaetospira]